MIYNMNNIEEFKLSDKFTVYRTKYIGKYNSQNFIKRVNDNKSLVVKKTIGGIDEKRLVIECDEFKSIDSFLINTLEKIKKEKIHKSAKFSWVYTQKNSETMVDMHKHEFLHYYTEKTKLETEFTCVFYIQIPKNLKEDEGNIVFMTEDKKLHKFVPHENDVLIFSGRLNHMITPIPNAEIERVVYASNFNFNLNLNIL